MAGQFILKKSLFTINGEIRVVIPNTRAMLAMLEPITLPNAKSSEPLSVACKLTNSSGAEVAKETTVIPIINFDKFSLNDKPTEDRTKNSPPTTSNKNPRMINKILI